jgi:hypothetical protein
MLRLLPVVSQVRTVWVSQEIVGTIAARLMECQAFGVHGLSIEGNQAEHFICGR